VIWTLLLDLVMALGFPPLFAPERPLAEAYVPCCASSPCECPKDSPCKKDCCKDGCTCKPSAPMTGGCCATYGCCPGQACVMPCPMPPVMAMPAMPLMATANLYQVQVKIGKDHCTTVMMPADNIPLAILGCNMAKVPYCQHVQLRLEDTNDGCVKLYLHANRGQMGCGGFPAMTAYQGNKKVHPDTVANVLLGGEEAEPLCAEVLVKAVGSQVVTPPVACAPCPPDGWRCPPPMPCVPPMPPPAQPPQTVTMPAPMPVAPPSVCLPEPLPLPAPAPSVQVIERCVATVPACCSTAHVELVRCCHKTTLAVQCEGVSAKSVRMTLDKGACGSLTVAAGKKHVHVHGKKWKAFADKVSIQADGRVLLSGHVKLLSEKLGVCASVKADELCVQVKDGAFEKIAER
jgi:hypothetical protein